MAVRLLLAAALTIAACFLWSLVLYWWRRRRYNRTWGRIPRNQWEQMASLIKYGPQLPLDEAQILADVEEWLQREDEDDRSNVA